MVFLVAHPAVRGRALAVAGRHGAACRRSSSGSCRVCCCSARGSRAFCGPSTRGRSSTWRSPPSLGMLLSVPAILLFGPLAALVLGAGSAASFLATGYLALGKHRCPASVPTPETGPRLAARAAVNELMMCALILTSWPIVRRLERHPRPARGRGGLRPLRGEGLVLGPRLLPQGPAAARETPRSTTRNTREGRSSASPSRASTSRTRTSRGGSAGSRYKKQPHGPRLGPAPPRTRSGRGSSASTASGWAP